MAKTDYFPDAEGEQATWAATFGQKILIHGPTLGKTAAESDALKDKAEKFVELVINVQQKKSQLKAAVDEKNLGYATYIKPLRTEIADFKTNPALTSEIAGELGIVGGDTSFDPATYKPEIKGSLFAGAVRIKFTKKGVDGVNIYHRKKGELVWKFLARDTKSPYDDHIELATPGTPEHWEYQAYGVIDDSQIGLASDIVEIVYGG